MTTESFDTIVIGTGFASSFFLHAYLAKVGPNERILVLERGHVDPHEWQVEHQTTSRIDHFETYATKDSDKEWQFSIGHGGGSNCWWANTPRMLPSDFELKSRYGVGADWPITYDDLEPYYSEAERIMSVAGPGDAALYSRSQPYPQRPHRLTDPETILKRAYPDLFFNMPSARASVATEHRPRCCATGTCYICPVDAKFTVQNEMQEVYGDTRVTTEYGAEVQAVDVVNNVAKGVIYTQEGVEKTAQADLVILGANALFNPLILLRSGFSHPQLGKGLNEQVGVDVFVDLADVDNYQGSTSITGVGYMAYDGPHRSERAAGLIETYNIPHSPDALRLERGKWRQRMLIEFQFEDLRLDQNYVSVDEAEPGKPFVVYKGYSEYTQRSIDALPELMPELLRPLPVEGFTVRAPGPTQGHIQGTAVMGLGQEASVVDPHLKHHQVRNLLVLGGSAFPTSPPAHPTLTISALSLWAAAHL